MFKRLVENFFCQYRFARATGTVSFPAQTGWNVPRDKNYWEMHSRRGPFGRFGSSFEDKESSGPRGSRFFGRGDVKFALLELLQERPMHGYEMMKELEERSGGVYVPSAGTIYPTLQMLEDRGFVNSAEAAGKKIYDISEAGRGALAEWKKEKEATPDEAEGKTGHHRHRDSWHTPEMHALKHEVKEVLKLMTIASRMALQDPVYLQRLRGILEDLRYSLSDMVYREQTGKDSAFPEGQTRKPD